MASAVETFLSHATDALLDASLIGSLRDAQGSGDEETKVAALRQAKRQSESRQLTEDACRELPTVAALILELQEHLLSAIHSCPVDAGPRVNELFRLIKAETYKAADNAHPKSQSKAGRPASAEVESRRESVLESIQGGKKRGDTVQELGITNSQYDDDRKALKAAGKLE